MAVTREITMSGTCTNCRATYEATADVTGKPGTSTYCETDIVCEGCGRPVKLLNIGFTFPSGKE